MRVAGGCSLLLLFFVFLFVVLFLVGILCPKWHAMASLPYVDDGSSAPAIRLDDSLTVFRHSRSAIVRWLSRRSSCAKLTMSPCGNIPTRPLCDTTI